MIAVSLFLVITIYGMGALLSATSLHKKSENMRQIMDNLSFVMEDMSRSLRTGYNYRCYEPEVPLPGRSDPSLNDPLSCQGGWAIAFEQQYGDPLGSSDQWIYKIESHDGGSTFNIWKSTDGATSFTQMTPSEINIDPTSSGFSVLGAEAPVNEAGNLQQPFVTVRLVGKITVRGIETPFSLQTSASQRSIDI